MPNALCDLHLHTYYSDGRFSPAEVLHHAASMGLKTLAITDHDNLDGLREATFVAGQLGLELLPGIELTTRWDDCIQPGKGDGGIQDVDLLGYFFDPQSPVLLKFTRAALSDLHERVAECCAALTAAGYPVTIQDVQVENPRYPGAIQLIHALRNKGYARDWNAAFSLFAAQWPKVRACGQSIQAAIDALHAAGGVAVLAHPVAIECAEGLLPAERVAALVEMGLDGLEVYHPRLDAAGRAHFLRLAQQFGLQVSGGSDEHGWQNGFARMGSQLVTYEMVNGLRERARQYQVKPQEP